MEQQVTLVFLLQGGQLLDAALGLGFLLTDVAVDALVVDDGVPVQRLGQRQSLQCAATAQGHIHLARGERLTSIDDGMVEGQALTFVDGDGPCQSQGVLGEGALHLGLYDACFGVQRVAGVFPFQWLHLNGLAVSLDSKP